MFIQNAVLDLFARSPIKPIQQHMVYVKHAVEALQPFFTAIIARDTTAQEKNYQAIIDGEHQADQLKKDVRIHLPRNILLSVCRSDLLDLLKVQDKLANAAKDIAGIMLGRKMSLPESTQPHFTQFVRRCINATQQAADTIDLLDSLQESGFRGKTISRVEEMIHEIDDIEHETDELQVTLRQAMYAIEDTLNPIDAMFLYKIIHRVGGIADLAQTVGHRLLLMTASR